MLLLGSHSALDNNDTKLLHVEISEHIYVVIIFKKLQPKINSKADNADRNENALKLDSYNPPHTALPIIPSQILPPSYQPERQYSPRRHFCSWAFLTWLAGAEAKALIPETLSQVLKHTKIPVHLQQQQPAWRWTQAFHLTSYTVSPGAKNPH